MATVIVGIVLAAAVVLAVTYNIRKKKNASDCGGGCAGCSGCR